MASIVVYKKGLLQMKKLFFTALFLIIYMAGFSQIKTGEPAPELSLPGQNGEIVRLSDLKGRVVLIDFWASWCGPCRKNNPHLVRLYHKYHERGLEIYGVSIDDNMSSWKQAVQHDQLEWVQVNDSKGWDAPSTILYGVDAIPASFLLDKNGIIKNKDLVGSNLEQAIKSLLKE